MSEHKCPRCKEESIELYLQSQSHLYLSDQSNLITFLPGTKKISKNGSQSPNIKVNYCESCHLVWFDLEEDELWKL